MGVCDRVWRDRDSSSCLAPRGICPLTLLCPSYNLSEFSFHQSESLQVGSDYFCYETIITFELCNILNTVSKECGSSNTKIIHLGYTPVQQVEIIQNE